MPGFDFDSANFNLTSIGKYLENEGINLSQDDKQKLNTIFQNSDVYNDREKKAGKDGVLNSQEWDNFIKNVEENIPKVLNKIKMFRTSLISKIIKDNYIKEQNRNLIPDKKLGVQDATRVNKQDVQVNVVSADVKKDVHPLKAEIVSKMSNRWKNAFPKSNVGEKFYSKLYDTLKTLNCSISDKEFNSEKYSCKEEQAMDEVCAIFAGEAQLKTTTIGYVGKKATFYGLFQLSSDGLKSTKAWAAKHPEVSGMSNIKSNLTLDQFRRLSAETQLDYLVAYIGASKDASKIDKNETISPSKLWSMIKLPNLNEDIPQKKNRRDKTTAQKNDSIQAIIKRTDKCCSKIKQ